MLPELTQHKNINGKIHKKITQLHQWEKQMMTQRTASEKRLSVVRECRKCYNIADGQIL